ncbi:MAG: hypothetical protein ACREF0_12350 [Acetobacteraceae bacterium]
MADCFAKAAAVCPSGYTIRAAEETSTPFINPYERSMYVHCN